MADRIYPSSKPNTTTTTTAPTFPAPKSQLYNANRPMYRPQPPRSSKSRRSGRGLCCSLCLWLTLLLVALVFLAAIAAGVFYLVYRPHRPSFSLSSLRLSSLNLSSSSLLTSHLDISITARNPNKKLVYVYDDITITTTTTAGAGAGAEVTIGTGTVPGFVHDAGNTTVVRAKVASEKESVDTEVAADLKKKKEIPVEIHLETRAGVKVGGVKTKKIGVSVACGAATVAVPAKGKKAAAGDTANCKVKLRIKIWKWTL